MLKIVEDVSWVPFKRFLFIDGIPKHVPITTEQPITPLKNGITTLEDKSLGCTQKAGAAVVQDVLKMGERIKTNGLNLLCTPGNDLVATTTLGCSGCQMVLFTTGRGTPFGGFIPTVKIATNTALATKKSNWIDFNAGDLVDKMDMDELLENFIDLSLLKVLLKSYQKDMVIIEEFQSSVLRWHSSSHPLHLQP
mgnify:CR=1 FL=1